jgi:hypothetical protein
MSNWQERITRDTAPEIRAEHELRYRLAAQLVGTSAVWADLGCGSGVGAAAAFGDRRPGRAVLIDLDADAVSSATEELAVPDTRQLTGDLTDPRILRDVEEAILAVDGDRIVTCFEVVEHLSTFVPLLEWSGSLARDGAMTFVISVPNDAFWSIENPYHATVWGEGAFDELRRLLPSEHTLLRQVGLTGSALVDWDGSPANHELTVTVGGQATVATHFIAAYGPRHAALQCDAVAAPTDRLAQRQWERQRESNLALTEATVFEQRETIAELSQQCDRLQATVSTHIAQFDDWRTYIHELERELGRPLSGGGSTTPSDGRAEQPSPPSTPTRPQT